MSKILNMNSFGKKEEQKKSNIAKDLQEIQRYKEKQGSNKPTIVIEFSWKLIFLILFGVLAVFLGSELLTVLIFLFGGFVFMSAAKPIVQFLVSKKLSKGLSVFLTYLLAIIVLGGIISIVIVPLAGQIDGLVKAIPGWAKTLTLDFEDINILGYTIDTKFVDKIFTDIIERLTMSGDFKNIASTLGSVFSFTALLFACVVFSIYLVIDHDNILEIGLARMTSDSRKAKVKKLILDMEYKVGKWLLGQAVVSSIAGIVTGTVLAILKVPFALPMGVFVALMSAIPSLGATIGSIPPLLVTLVVHGPITTLAVLIIFLIYQQIENNLIIPKIMGDVMGVRPIFIMFAAITFFILFGVWGAVLAVPIIVIGKICYEFYIDLQKSKAKGSI